MSNKLISECNTKEIYGYQTYGWMEDMMVMNIVKCIYNN